ncbi:hypothetical protein BVRB_1g008310 [Beta vulgaris subsp. vulgaris]|nr:hypothetical protein BVRB_1g008310 [Beta vulgaris subsp. vulgaris]
MESWGFFLSLMRKFLFLPNLRLLFIINGKQELI